MTATDRTLQSLCQKIKEREQGPPLTFKQFMDLSAARPELVFRNIFQRFHDMIQNQVGDGIDEYPDDPESISFVYYDCNRLFVDGTDHPFFADRLFANRLVNQFSSCRRGTQQNRIYIFQGPHGCGKSTFLNNLLLKFEQYTRTREGTGYEILWRLHKKDLGAASDQQTHYLLNQLRGLVDHAAADSPEEPGEHPLAWSNKEYLEVPCPSHDSPWLLIPKAYRKQVLDQLIDDVSFKQQLFSDKQYEWVFHDQPCTICLSLYQTLLDRLDSPAKVFEMVHARRHVFNRRLGQGISVYNPGDPATKNHVLGNPQLQHQINSLLMDSNRVRYLYSHYANTNNGVYALMDIKAHNKERFANLHGIISEGVHKVEDIEENVNSLFLAIMNPEDQVNIADTQSFSDRITYIKIPYILDYNTEVKIYKNVFGDDMESHFLPRVLPSFAKVIVSSRLQPKSEAMEGWIKDPGKYHRYCDRNLQLLKMDIYTGLIPPWLSEEDRKNFTAKKRHRIIAESEIEGDKGITGRDSLNIFNEFISTYVRPDRLITMAMVCSFFKKYQDCPGGPIPGGFLDSLVRLYNYTTLEEVKESLYYYNEDRISREIKNYLFAINFEPGSSVKCAYTGEDLEISESYLESVERRVLGPGTSAPARRTFRKETQQHYTAKTLSQEMHLEGKAIEQTELYRMLHQRYVHNLKENVMDPFVGNDNFRGAIKDHGSEGFRSYDARIREDVNLLIKNLTGKYGYTEQGAKEVCIYVIDNDLARTFATNPGL